jgi:hypothetical protein
MPSALKVKVELACNGDTLHDISVSTTETVRALAVQTTGFIRLLRLRYCPSEDNPHVLALLSSFGAVASTEASITILISIP